MTPREIEAVNIVREAAGYLLKELADCIEKRDPPDRRSKAASRAAWRAVKLFNAMMELGDLKTAADLLTLRDRVRKVEKGRILRGLPMTFPESVGGWLTEEEGQALAELAADKYVIEIGSYLGRSTICLAQTAKHVYAVDPHDGRGTPFPADTLERFLGNLAAYGVSDRVTVFRGCAGELADAGQLPIKADVAFIDGAHDVDAVRTDIRVVRQRLPENASIAFHDYRFGTPQQGFDAGVEEAVNEFLASGAANIVSRHGSVVIVKLTKPGNVPIGFASL